MPKLTVDIESWSTKVPFSITGHTFMAADVIVVTLKEGIVCGRGEASGVYYRQETTASMLAQINSVKTHIEQGIDRQQLQSILPAGGARNAIDCALWDLEAKSTHKSIWQLTGIEPRQTITVNTLSIEAPEVMAKTAAALDTPSIKVKLDGHQPLACIQAVRTARPDADIVVDVNQGWTFPQLVELAPTFQQLGISMIEQPLPRGADAELEHYTSPVPLCADESCLDTSELGQTSRRYQMINIKLDKTGGLTEGLKLARQAKAKGMGLMVGNMLGTSLAMAPAYVVAQLCQLADLDGPVLLANDRQNPMTFAQGIVSAPELWG